MGAIEHPPERTRRAFPSVRSHTPAALCDALEAVAGLGESGFRGILECVRPALGRDVERVPGRRATDARNDEFAV